MAVDTRVAPDLDDLPVDVFELTDQGMWCYRHGMFGHAV
jgi:hypothetical protein